ncbi:MAG: class I SAM-dependent methyltransferase [Hyphomicrobiales bacterium]
MYTELAEWFHAITAPEDYEVEAGIYRRLLEENARGPVRTVLELGSGGGNNASHLKYWFELTLVDPAPGMLAVSRRLNPECEHIEGDMRKVRLGRTFDAVFIHDAIAYMTTEDELRAAFETAHVHLRPGGVALFVPDCTKETFQEGTWHGGHDRDGRSLRYLEWRHDPDPGDNTYLMEFVYLLSEGGGPSRVVPDVHLCGLFARATWLRLLGETGFAAMVVPLDVSGAQTEEWQAFVAVKPE